MTPLLWWRKRDATLKPGRTLRGQGLGAEAFFAQFRQSAGQLTRRNAVNGLLGIGGDVFLFHLSFPHFSVCSLTAWGGQSLLVAVRARYGQAPRYRGLPVNSSRRTERPGSPHKNFEARKRLW